MSNPNDILASLTGGSGDGDLFGGQEIVPPEAAVDHPTNTQQQQPPNLSKLLQSGLLHDTSDDGGGLFDTVDAEQKEAEQRKQEAEEAARQQQQQAELQQQQHQLNQQMMESVHLGSGGDFPFAAGGPSQQQHHPMYATPPRGGSTLHPQQQQPPFVGQPPPVQSHSMTMMGQPNIHNTNPPQQQFPGGNSVNSGYMGQSMPPQPPHDNMSQSAVPSNNHHSMMGPPQPPQNNPMMSQSVMMPQNNNIQHPNSIMSQSMMHPPQAHSGINNHQMMSQSMMHPPQAYQNPMHQQHQQPSMSVSNHSPYGHSNAYGGPQPLPNAMAGMHNMNPSQGLPPQMRAYPVPPAPTQYGSVTVDQPILLAGKGSLFVKATPYWSYQIATQVAPHVWVVRRRFRDVVALEDRLRQDCPGAILPPRPDKHATRAIEEASAQQSQEFAIQRANELQVYLQQLVQHPMASQSGTLRFFLSLQDELGTAWPEVSSNAITRLANAGVEAAVKTAEQWTPETDSEDNAELLALYSMESVRMGAVLQAVPKLEGALSLVQEHSELCSNAGMEMGRWLKSVDGTTSEGLEILAGAWLRSGRRSKRLSLELSAACASYSQQYKLCRNERLAFSDRRAALQRRAKERKSHMGSYNPYGGYPQDMAGQEADEIGRRLLSEVSRIAIDRRRDWSGSLKIIAASFKEAAAERSAIWQATLTQFDQHYPGYYNTNNGNVEAMQAPVYAQQQQQQQHQQEYTPSQQHLQHSQLQHQQHYLPHPQLMQQSQMAPQEIPQQN